jgi:hypothetical protein
LLCGVNAHRHHDELVAFFGTAAMSGQTSRHASSSPVRVTPVGSSVNSRPVVSVLSSEETATPLSRSSTTLDCASERSFRLIVRGDHCCRRGVCERAVPILSTLPKCEAFTSFSDFGLHAFAISRSALPKRPSFVDQPPTIPCVVLGRNPGTLGAVRSQPAHLRISARVSTCTLGDGATSSPDNIP